MKRYTSVASHSAARTIYSSLRSRLANGISSRWVLIALCTIGGLGWTGCARDRQQIDDRFPEESHSSSVLYHGLRADDPASVNGVINPGRGFRTETLFALPEGVTFAANSKTGRTQRINLSTSTKPTGTVLWAIHGMPVENGYRDQRLRAELSSWRQRGVAVVQGYCYLDDYADRALSPEFLARLERGFATIRAAGMKVLLRFAYEPDQLRAGGPTLGQIVRHIRQLKPVLRRNADVILAVQEGFIGAWGEGHHATHIPDGDARAHTAVLDALLDVLPEDRMVMVRLPKFKNMFLDGIDRERKLDEDLAHSDHPAARIGYHNDGLLAGATDGGTFGRASLRDRDFLQIYRESPFVLCDGELFWSDRGWPDRGPGANPVDGWQAAQRMRLHHYTTFSLTHSNSEFEGRAYSIDRWKRTRLTRRQVVADKMPLSEGYFENTAGQSVTRTVFDYIRDHLGYRIELQQAWFEREAEPGDKLRVRVSLHNRGFAVLHDPRPVLLVLVSPAGKVLSFETDADVREWYPHNPGDYDFEPLLHQVKGRVVLPDNLASGIYSLGLWLPDARDNVRLDPRYAIRFANRNVDWWEDSAGRYGINILGQITVRRREERNSQPPLATDMAHNAIAGYTFASH
jgi:hypothetical protein